LTETRGVSSARENNDWRGRKTESLVARYEGLLYQTLKSMEKPPIVCKVSEVREEVTGEGLERVRASNERKKSKPLPGGG